jgi:hypothetical protein
VPSRPRLRITWRSSSASGEEVLRRAGIELLHLPTDVCACSPEHLELGVSWVRRHLAAGERVLVHCQWGIGRSALLSLCVLVALGCPPVDALLHAKNRREKLSPSPDQLRAFLEHARIHRERSGARWPVPDFEEVARIAYRHLAARSGDEAELAASSTLS